MDHFTVDSLASGTSVTLLLYLPPESGGHLVTRLSQFKRHGFGAVQLLSGFSGNQATMLKQRFSTF